MDEESFDLLGESFCLPEDLQAIAVGEDGFPTRAYILPDELRGALLLPSDSGSFSNSHQTGETSQDKGSSGSELRISPGLVGLASDTMSSSPRRSGHDRAAMPAVSPDGGASGGGSSKTACSFQSSGNRSGAWSLSDTDLRELLERGSSPDGGIGVGLAPVLESSRLAAPTPQESSSAPNSSTHASIRTEQTCGVNGSAHGSSPPSVGSKSLSSQQHHSHGTLSGSSHTASATAGAVPHAARSPPMSSPSASLQRMSSPSASVVAQSVTHSLTSPSQPETSRSSGSEGRPVAMRIGATAAAQGANSPWSGAIRSQISTQSSIARANGGCI